MCHISFRQDRKLQNSLREEIRCIHAYTCTNGIGHSNATLLNACNEASFADMEKEIMTKARELFQSEIKAIVEVNQSLLPPTWTFISLLIVLLNYFLWLMVERLLVRRYGEEDCIGIRINLVSNSNTFTIDIFCKYINEILPKSS